MCMKSIGVIIKIAFILLPNLLRGPPDKSESKSLEKGGF